MSFATQLAAEIVKRGYPTSVRREPEGARVCVIGPKPRAAAHGDGDESPLYQPVVVEIWDYGQDAGDRIDIRWLDAEGRSHEISSRTIAAYDAANRIIGPISS